MQENKNNNMADDVDESGEGSVAKTLDSVVETPENPQKTLHNESMDKEYSDTSSEKSTPKKDGCNEEKESLLNVSSCSDDEKIATFENTCVKDSDLSLQQSNTPANEQVSDLEMKVDNSDFVRDGHIARTQTSAEIPFIPEEDGVHETASSSTHLHGEVQPEATEFRHRHLREREENVEEILPSQSRVSFGHGLQDREEPDVVHDDTQRSIPVTSEKHKDRDSQSSTRKFSIFKYFMAEISRGYILELDEDKYADKRRKVYTFMKIPRQVEKLMIFGFMLCLDCFIFMFTFLPLRVLVALWKLVSGVFCCKKTRLLEPAQICDLLKASIIVVCCCLLEYVDFSVMYHTVRGQSVIKLYVIYNMLEVADRLFSSFGQDILDSLFWTATEPRDRKRQHFGTIPHFALGVIYVFLHALLVLFQATCLNVAVNSHNKALLVILVSNQFVELKGSVFKKFERNNLFQMACSDIRERFHYLVLVSIVCLRNLTEFNWNLEHLYVISPYLFVTVTSEYFVDWVKHAFITKFNDIQPEVYTEYRSRLAQDATSSRQKNAYADHFDLVSRRMGFIPLPLGSLVIRVVRHSIHISGIGGVVLVIATFLFLMSVKILNSIIFLGKASQYAKEYPATESTTNSQHATYASNPSETSHHGTGQSTSTQSSSEQEMKAARKPTKSLAEIERYTLCSKEIVLF